MYKCLENHPIEAHSNTSCCLYITALFGMQVYMYSSVFFNVRLPIYFIFLFFLLLWLIYRKRYLKVVDEMSKKNI